MKLKKGAEVWRALALFFAGMAALTVLSRFLDSLMVPKVRVSTYTSGGLSYDIEGEGIIKAAETVYIDIPEGIKVDKVLSCGEKVEAGQGIVFLRLSDLEEKKKQLERDIRKIRLSLESEKLNGIPSHKIPETDRQAGDLALQEKKAADAMALLQKAQEEYARGLEELDKKRERDERFAKQQLANSREEIERNNRGVDKDSRQSYAPAELDYDKALAGIEEEYEGRRMELENKVQEAALRVNDVQDEYNRMLYNIGLAAREDTDTAANDRTAARISGKAQEKLQIDIDIREEELRSLEELILAEGQVKSAYAGVITRMDAKPGVTTGGDDTVEIGSGPYILTGTLDKEETGLLEEGDSLDILVSTVSRKVIGSISNISMNITDNMAKEEDKYAMFTASMEAGEYRLGSTVKYSVHKNSAHIYDCLIPIGAVREDGMGKYCLVVEENATILGKEDIAVRVNLEVLETDGKYAAVNSVFTEDDRIITGSNKSIKEGDRVRIEP